MNPTLILGAIVVLPIIVLLLLRINAALVFLSLSLGVVLVQFVAPDANTFFSLFSAHNFGLYSAGSNTVKLVLLLAPAVLTAVFMIRTIKGKFRLLLNILPSAGVGLLAALLVVPLMSAGLQHEIVGSSLWLQAQRSQDLIVGSSAMVCMFVLWLQRPKTAGKHHR